MTKRTALYRHFNDEGRLLYVGISLDPLKRTSQHMNAAHWAQQIGAISIRWYPTRGAAVDAEQTAIEEEFPLFNLADRPREPEPEIDDAAEMAKFEAYLASRKPVAVS